jgi:hypothetical protein
MAVDLEKSIEDNKEEIVALSVAGMISGMSTCRALLIEEAKRRAATLIDLLHRA